ncbi:hypothetical protein K435DRAFT_904476 [Dendrothele bispora CBS 962.96]|uniref:CxC5 like cysteine cluster associated with KDZ domain-containing protein n=1 Tax=Dendrothele bispora (strain CBS 962.96) TaxID=1314807 RepID=A0A4S8LVV2_DENBC|nr:hypothetical protein K435DRAFT_904476 [Dendrothele bispora CBS 962.96]
MVSLVQILRSLSVTSRNVADILLSQIIAFVVVSMRIKNNILLLYPSNQQPQHTPPTLPRETKIFLGETCRMKLEDVDACWSAVKDVVWAEDKILGGVKSEAALYNTFHTFRGMFLASPKSLWPPTFICTNIECPYVKNGKALKLQTAVEHNAILYTLSMGPLPIRTHYITCEGCGITYHPDYYVKTELSSNERLRHYYDANELPDAIQVATHHFVETKLARMWTNSMLYGWNSASNCARVYEQTFIVGGPAISRDWTVQANVQPEFVNDAFKIFSLLQYHQTHGSHLCVPQEIDQAYRFDDEMERINREVYEHGQPEIDHRCEKCVRTVVDELGNICEVFAVVCDGVTVGRSCCGVPHCDGQLLSTRDAFCKEHQDKKLICRVTGCTRPIESKNSKACDLSEHQALENQYHETERATFQLKLRYERTRKADEQANAEWDNNPGILSLLRRGMYSYTTVTLNNSPRSIIFVGWLNRLISSATL